MSKQLLIECYPFKFDVNQINETITNNNGSLVVSGVLQRADAKNQNGRIYPKRILEREVTRYLGTEVKENRALGELDHPDSNIINLRNVSHQITEIFWNGNDLVGKIKILDTPSGNILKSLFREGVTLGISSRGLGSVKSITESNDMEPTMEVGWDTESDDMEPTMEVQEDFQLIGWDFVSNPSTHGAFMTPLKESIEINNINEAHILCTDIICELSNKCNIEEK